MHLRRLFSLTLVAVLFACEGHESPTAPGMKSVPTDPSAVFSDGAHGGNPDFFFLPPLVPLPLSNPNFQLGKFDNTMRVGLKVEICKLQPAGGLPTPTTQCVDGAPLKTFAPGSVQVVNLPLTQNGWWTAFGLPADGFYYVLWDTRQFTIDVTSYYRIKVFADGMSAPLGFADVDPMANLREWKSALTGQVVELLNGTVLPIPFRVERGAFCATSNNCTSVLVTNDNPNGDFQDVKVDDGNGSIAGARFPDGWLPAGFSSVVVTIRQVPSTELSDGSRVRTVPCHADIPLYQQFNGCFSFTTSPVIPRDPETNKAFAKSVTVAVCYTLYGSGDPRENFAELYASGPGEPAHALDDVSDGGLLAINRRSCENQVIIGSRSSNPLVQLASSGWRKIKNGFGQLFGVQTAYAIDVGLGGLLDAFTSVGAAIPAEIAVFGSTGGTLPFNVTSTVAQVRITGSHVHGANTTRPRNGINNMPVTFTVTPANGHFVEPLTGASISEVTVPTGTVTVVDGEIGTLVDGVAGVQWVPPTAAGTYQMMAQGPASGGPVTLTVTVPPQPQVVIDGVMSSGEWDGALNYDFLANVPGGGTTAATLFVKNDAQNVYFAVKYARAALDAGDNRVGFEFDGNNDGVGPANGDDYFGFQQTPITVFSDAYRSGGGETVTTDTKQDGAGAFHNDGAFTVFEISHPLNSAQPGQDFALAPGSTMGFFMQLIIGGVTTTYPGPFITYTPYTITGP